MIFKINQYLKQGGIISKKASKFLIMLLFLVITMILSIIVTFFLNSILSKSTKETSLKINQSNYLAQENTNLSYVESSDGKLVPIPEGYTASKIEGETSVKNGFVIYEGNVKWDTNENLSNDPKVKEKQTLQWQANYNQYVWIPVTEEELKNIYGIDRNGKLWGKLYSYDTLGRSSKDWKEKEGKMQVSFGTNYFEPGLGYGMNINIVSEMQLRLKLDKNREELVQELEQDYYETIKSIKKYGGFYIGRYETGITDNQVVVRKMNENLANQNWADMYLKTKKLKGEKDDIVTSMIWSSLWDHTLEWFVKTGSQTYDTIYHSTSYGNYRYSSFSYNTDIEGNTTRKESGSSNSKIIPSGASEHTKVNNIYDMAGNVNELTLGCYGYCFCFRGGYYDASTDAETSFGYRGYQEMTKETSRTGSRAILLLK